LLESLARETGKSVSALMDKALQGLEDQIRSGYANGETDDSHTEHDPSLYGTPKREASVLDIFREAREAIPDETWEQLPSDLATQHDHYIYGTPKRPA
jgi:hypothetical protein